MNRFYIFLFFLLLGNQSDAQEKLYFFISADSTRMGVKDELGKVIIPAIYPTYLWNDSISQEIVSETIEFYGLPVGQNPDFSVIATATGAIYNRAGEFLYHAQYFDNGPDYWKEGVRRYVDNGKMGFVDKSGQKVTVALWDFVEPFNYGYAKVMEGDLIKIYDGHGEHWNIGSKGEIVEYLINKQGLRVEGYEKAKDVKDYFYDGKYYPYPFEYTEEEQQILENLAKDSVGLSFLFNKKECKAQLEIVEFPNSYRPYYAIIYYKDYYPNSFEPDIYIDSMTKDGYIMNYDGTKKPLRQAIIENLEDVLKTNELIFETREKARNELYKLKSHPEG